MLDRLINHYSQTDSLMETLLHNNFVTIQYDDEKHYVLQEWSNEYAKFEDFKHVIDETVEICMNRDFKAIISDTRSQSTVDSISSNYAASVMPQLMDKGLQRFAFVTLDENVDKLGIDDFTKQTGEGVVKPFNNMEDAINWISTS